MVPQQVISPGTGLSESIDIFASEEKRLNIHLLDIEFAVLNFIVDPLMRRIKATGMTDHRNLTAFFLCLNKRLSVSPRVGHRDFDLHMLASFEYFDCLSGVHLCWCTQDNCIDLRQG